jgi:hypothetical protein
LAGSERVTREDKKCDECGTYLLSVQYKKGSSPLPGVQTQYTACIICDTFMSSTIVNPYSKKKQVEETEESKKLKEEKKKLKEEKKAAKKIEEEK